MKTCARVIASMKADSRSDLSTFDARGIDASGERSERRQSVPGKHGGVVLVRGLVPSREAFAEERAKKSGRAEEKTGSDGLGAARGDV